MRDFSKSSKEFTNPSRVANYGAPPVKEGWEKCKTYIA